MLLDLSLFQCVPRGIYSQGSGTHEACSNLAQTPSLTNDLHSCTSLGTMKQQILSSHIPLCHRHMVIATTLLGGRGGYSKVNMQFCNMAGILFTKNVNNIFSWCSLCATWKQKSYTLQKYVEGVSSIVEGVSRGWRAKHSDKASTITSLQMTSTMVLKGPDFFLLRTAPSDHQPLTANCHQPPTATNRQPPTTTNRQPSTAANRRKPPISNCQLPPTAAYRRQPPPTTNRQPPTGNLHQPPTANRHQPWLNI